MSLFEESKSAFMPLAARIRPENFDEFVGQEHIVGEGSPIRKAIAANALGSVILWGPAGCGKTTLAHLIAKQEEAHIEHRSAVACGIAEIREIAKAAKLRRKKTILFLDEIHHFTRTQQDALLGYIEDGTITLIGATTENPTFSLASPLLSRCRILILKPLHDEDVIKIVQRALDTLNLECSEEALRLLARWANGDARVALNALELSAQIAHPKNKIEAEDVSQSMSRPLVRYDGKQDLHYDVISAFIKSVRGSDVDAALHYLARMIQAGEDPRFIARRLVILASEDIGNAEPMALLIAMTAFHAVERIGMPESQLTLAQATIFLAASPKSNSCYSAIERALEDLEKKPSPPVPFHLRDTYSRKIEERVEGKPDEDYLYPHDYGGWVEQSYLAENHGLSLPYYIPIPRGYEKKIKEFLDSLKKREE